MVVLGNSVDAQTGARLAATATGSTATDLRFLPTFGQIRAVRELADGRMLILELRERAIYMVDALGRSARQVGRKGDGPGEYRSPARLFALAADSTLVIDGTNRKWYLLDDVRFVGLAKAMSAMQARTDAEVDGVDRLGNILQLTGLGKPDAREPWRLPWRPQYSDSLALLLHRPNGRIDTLARLNGQYFGMSRKVALVNGTPRQFFGILNPLQTHDQAVMYKDGSLAVARFDPYRVDRRDASGTWRRGTPVNNEAVRVTYALKVRAARAAMLSDDGTPIFAVADFPPWPSIVPAFLPGALHPGDDGQLYVVRTIVDAASERVVDVFDKSGNRTQTVTLPMGSRFLGAGIRGLYVALRDENEEEYLVRLRVVTGAHERGTNKIEQQRPPR